VVHAPSGRGGLISQLRNSDTVVLACLRAGFRAARPNDQCLPPPPTTRPVPMPCVGTGHADAPAPSTSHVHTASTPFILTEAQAERWTRVPPETSLRRDGPYGALITGPLHRAPRGPLRRLRFASRRLHPWQVPGAVTHSPCRVRTLPAAAPLAAAAGGHPTPDAVTPNAARCRAGLEAHGSRPPAPLAPARRGGIPQNGVRGEPQSLPRGTLVCGGPSRVGAVNTAPDGWPGRNKRAASRQGLKGGAAHRSTGTTMSVMVTHLADALVVCRRKALSKEHAQINRMTGWGCVPR